MGEQIRADASASDGHHLQSCAQPSRRPQESIVRSLGLGRLRASPTLARGRRGNRTLYRRSMLEWWGAVSELTREQTFGRSLMGLTATYFFPMAFASAFNGARKSTSARSTATTSPVFEDAIRNTEDLRCVFCRLSVR